MRRRPGDFLPNVRQRFWLICLLVGVPLSALHAQIANPQGTFREWPVRADPIRAYYPLETVDDPQGLTGRVGGPAMVTAVEGATGDYPFGMLYWNPATNLFKMYNWAGGVGVDVNRSTPSSGPPTFGGGDVWNDTPCVHFRGSDLFRCWPFTNSAIGVRVNAANGKVYLANRFSPSAIFELDPVTNQYRAWITGSNPYFLVLDGNFVYATAAAGGGYPDQILRLDVTTNTLTRWNVPGGGFQTAGIGVFNFITEDAQAQVWFALTAANEIGVLNPTTNVIEEYTKPGVSCPSGVATTGLGPTLQIFFSDQCSSNVGLMVWSLATPTTSALVIPTIEAVQPTVTSVTPYDLPVTPITAIVTPQTATSTATDPSGIYLFGVPRPGFFPTGMSRVAFPQTVFGSLLGDGYVYQFTSAAVVASQPGTVTGGGFIAVAGGSATFGFNVKQTQQNGAVTGQLEYHNHATDENVHSVTIDSLAIVGNAASFTGTCTNNGVPCTFTVNVQDNGEPGADKDVFQIQGTVVTPEGGTLKGGNIEIHPQ